MREITWTRKGYGYEVSSLGDKRFSAFNTYLPDGRSIEMHYQCDVKGIDPGGTNWRLGKGKPPIIQNVDLWGEYLKLWRTWSDNHPDLIKDLLEKVSYFGDVLKDTFAATPINQARALSVILNESLNKQQPTDKMNENE